jgi:hypothetical protein
MENVRAAQCVRECIKGGSDFGLISGDKVYTLKGDSKQFDKFAGQSVTIKGEVSGTTVTFQSIAAK